MLSKSKNNHPLADKHTYINVNDLNHKKEYIYTHTLKYGSLQRNIALPLRHYETCSDDCHVRTQMSQRAFKHMGKTRSRETCWHDCHVYDQHK